MLSAVLELDAGARDEVCDGSRHEYLRRAGEGGDASTEVDCDSADVLAAQFDLSGVNPGADFDPKGCESVADRAGAIDRAGGPVKGRQRAVAGCLDLDAAKTGQLRAHDSVMVVEQVPPALVAEFCRSCCGSDDVGEHDGRQHPLEAGRGTATGQELGDLFDELLAAGAGWVVIVSGDLY